MSRYRKRLKKRRSIKRWKRGLRVRRKNRKRPGLWRGGTRM